MTPLWPLPSEVALGRIFVGLEDKVYLRVVGIGNGPAWYFPK